MHDTYVMCTIKSSIPDSQKFVSSKVCFHCFVAMFTLSFPFQYGTVVWRDAVELQSHAFLSALVQFSSVLSIKLFSEVENITYEPCINEDVTASSYSSCLLLYVQD